ncbi:MAG: hypothetical protein JJU37_13995 [Balneolaceae bacterium]|nr:hypothetical protein [Balneolaceae bacterium]
MNKSLIYIVFALFLVVGCSNGTNGNNDISNNFVELDGDEVEILWLDCLNVSHEGGMRRMVLELGDADDTINFGIDGEGNRPGIYIAHNSERWNAQYTADSDNVAEMDDNGARGDLQLTWDKSVGTRLGLDRDRPDLEPIHLVFDLTCP